MSATIPAAPARPGTHAPRAEHRRTRAGSVRAAAATLIACVALAGCGLRLETPPPAALTPDAVELVRSATVDDALTLAATAEAITAARAQAGTPEDALTPVLVDVAAFSTRHAEQLGGVYDSGLDATPGATPTPTATAPAATPEPAEVATLLADAAGSARAAAVAVEDGDLARLLASVAVARSSLLTRVSAAIGVPVPTSTEPAPEPGSSVEPGVVRDPATYSGLVVAEDEVGYAYEVMAAQLTDDARERARAAAARHRERGEVWARVCGVDGTSIDPRRTAYAVPTGLEDPAVALELARTLEVRLTAGYASVVALAAPEERAEVVSALATSDAEATAWGAPPVAFPGLPEQDAASGVTGTEPSGELAGDESG